MRRPSATKTMPTRPCRQIDSAVDEAFKPAAKRFGELLYEERHRLGLSLRQLAEKARIPASALSELENGRRLPPDCAVVAKLAIALQLPPEKEQRLTALALQERTGLGLRVARTTPRHVADLLRDIACMGPLLSPAQVRSIRHTLEVTMK